MFSVHFCLHIDLTITAAQKSPEKQERKNGQDISSADTDVRWNFWLAYLTCFSHIVLSEWGFINLCYDAEDVSRILDVEVKAEIGII